MNFVYFTIYLFMLLPSKVTLSNYCNISKKNFLCGKRGFDPNCGDASRILVGIPKRKDQDEIVLSHNRYRDLVASGRAIGGLGKKYPTASNMVELIWDNEMAQMAEGFVKTCSKEPSCLKCRSTHTFGPLGENIHTISGNHSLAALFGERNSWTDIIGKSWSANEAKKYDARDVDQFSDRTNTLGNTNLVYSHLTQIIWAETKRVGCARIAYKEKERGNMALSVCHYGPAGNQKGARVYKRGKPCTACKANVTCSKQYGSLCSISLSKNVRQDSLIFIGCILISNLYLI